MYNSILDVELAKNLIQIRIVTNNKVVCNKEVTVRQFTSQLAKTLSGLIIIEACSTSNYWQ